MDTQNDLPKMYYMARIDVDDKGLLLMMHDSLIHGMLNDGHGGLNVDEVLIRSRWADPSPLFVDRHTEHVF
jgi:hypothetical protein